MADLFGEGIIQILQTGFVGVSILLMYMGYRLLDRSIGSEKPAEILRINRTSIFGFLGFSLFVMLGALYITLFPPIGKININMEVYPKQANRIEMLDLRVAGRRQSVPTNDSNDGQMGLLTNLELRQDHQVTIDLSKIENHIEKLATSIESLNVAQSTLQLEKDALLNEMERFKEKTAQDALNSRGIVITEEIISEESGA